MYSKIMTCILHGLQGYSIEVEGHLARGLPSFTIVGLPDAAIKESKERVRSAIQNSGYQFPVARITINLSPANLRKEGSQLDLAIALSILSASGIVEYEVHDKTAFIGELALSGKLVGVPGALPMIIALKELGYQEVILPTENINECAGVEGITLIAADTLTDVVAHLNEEQTIMPTEHQSYEETDPEYFNFDYDFSEIKGQENLKRAMEIAAAGHHNILLVGPPGSGKTMAAYRLPSILPPLSFDESLESTKIYSITNQLKQSGLIHRRPFRNPHHTSSAVSLIGGGTIPKPGEVSLAHNGVLFLDEFPEFQKSVIEALRQPMEDGTVTISRANAQFTFPSDFLLVAGMNPCPCGYYGDTKHECKCSVSEIQRYLGKISFPILDRIDIHVEVSAVPYEDLQSKDPGESSENIRKRVDNARKIQQERYKDDPIRHNSQLTPKLIKKYIPITESMDALLKMTFDTYRFSARSLNKVLKLARTIADLAGEELVNDLHLLEAIRFRTAAQKFWE